MITVLAFAAAAAAGGLARAEAGRRWNRHEGFPFGTLVVNVAGSFALGLVHTMAPPALTVLGVGALGAFTTVSSFARDTAALLELRRAALAMSYAMATGLLGVGAAALGVALA